MEHRTEYDLKAIGRNLKHLRESRHLTVEQVREYLCLGSVQAVYKYESGTGYPQADTLLALMEGKAYIRGLDDYSTGKVRSIAVSNVRFPWNRTFELTFDIRSVLY